ncbi:hypothetical protein [Ascidiaceihabitans sp.]|uniref:hypothetical protein n=1 Tax=Ascidiaceihabitans sp. TaxID=1872644 RepID=UPI0032971212
MNILKHIPALCFVLLGTAQTAKAQDVYYYGSTVLFSKKNGGQYADNNGQKIGLGFQIDGQRLRFSSEITRLKLPFSIGTIEANAARFSAQYTFDNTLFFNASYNQGSSKFVDRFGRISANEAPDERRFAVGRETDTMRFGVGATFSKFDEKTDLFFEWFVRPQTYLAVQYTDTKLSDQMRFTVHHRADDLTLFAEAQFENHSDIIATGFRQQSIFVSAEHRSFKNLALTAQLYYANTDRTRFLNRQKGIAVGARYYFTPEFSTFLSVGHSSDRVKGIFNDSGARVSFGLIMETSRPNAGFGLPARSETRNILQNPVY